MRLRLAVTAAIIALGAGVAIAADAPAPTPQGYLADGAIDTLKIIPPAPPQGTPRADADTAVFLATRTLKDGERWKLAQNDVDERGILKDLSCAAGVDLDPKSSPRLSALVLKMSFDIRRAVDQPKNFYKRPRPYLLADGPICIDKTDALAKSPDYPSGHVTWGWSIGLVLAEVDPDRATDILVRARAFGESRLVCGVHSLSAVEAGRTNASALVAALHGSPAFRADLDGVRQEIAALRAAGPRPDAAACSIEAALTAKSPY